MTVEWLVALSLVGTEACLVWQGVKRGVRRGVLLSVVLVSRLLVMEASMLYRHRVHEGGVLEQRVKRTKRVLL